MGLQIPLGLIALLGIPLLILIYIIKPKYHERTISSTYIWKLSQKYRKRKNPFDKITKSLLLIIQIFAISLMTILIAEPFYNKKNEVIGEQVFILDASASMNAKDGSNVTRYEKAKKSIYEKIENSPDDVKNTIIFASSEPYYLVERETDKYYIKHVLETTECTFDIADYNASVKAASKIADLNDDIEVSLYTDHGFEKSGEINVVDLSNGEWNAAIVSASISYNQGYYEFKAQVVSYNQSKKLNLVLELEGVPSDTPNVSYDGKLTDSQTINLQKNVKSDLISFQNLKVYEFSQAKFVLKDEAGNIINDSFDYDNEYYTFGGDEKKFDVEIVSESPVFIENVLRSMNKCNIQIRKPDAFINKGFDLYIFDSVGPQTLPIDGACWIINPLANKIYQDAGFSTSNEKSLLSSSSDNWNCLKGTSTEALSTGIMDSVLDFGNIKVSKYAELSNISDYYSVCLTTQDGSPLILAGNQGLKNLVVFAFDLHYSSLPVSINMPILFKNLVDYSLKRTTNQYQYEIGDKVELNLKSNTEKVTINYAGVKFEYTEFNEPIIIETNKGGVCYVIIETSSSKKALEYNFFVKISDDESDFTKKEKTLGAFRKTEDKYNSSKVVESTSEDLSIWFAIGLLVMLIVEWGVQYREQY